MFKFLKRFKKEKEKITISSDELERWFAAKVAERINDMDGAVQALYGAVEHIRDALREQHRQLSEAKIRDEDKIEARVKSIVLGHRENYCRELSIFLNNIEIPMETHLDHGMKLNADVKNALDAFAQQTYKSFQATQHLFHREVEAIASSLKELSDTTRGFDELLEKKGIHALDDIRTQLDELKRESAKLDRLQQELRMRKARQDMALKSKEAQINEISTLRESSDFKDYQALLERRTVLVDQCAAIERDIAGLFLELERVLRKYEYTVLGEEQKLVRAYLHDPKEALKMDSTLALWPVLVQIRDNVASLGLKEEQQQRLAEQLGQHSREKLEHIRKQYLALIEERELVRKRIETHHTAARLKEKEYKLTHFEEQVQRFGKEIEQLQGELDAVRVRELGKKVEEEISRALDVELTVAYD